jgi:hypothetical protein
MVKIMPRRKSINGKTYHWSADCSKKACLETSKELRKRWKGRSCRVFKMNKYGQTFHSVYCTRKRKR